MAQGSVRAPFTCKLISDVPRSLWHLRANFPLPLKWDLIFWSWYQDHRQIINLDLPFCRDMQMPRPPPGIAPQVPATLAWGTCPSFLQKAAGTLLHVTVPDIIRKVHLIFLHRTRSHTCSIYLQKSIFTSITSFWQNMLKLEHLNYNVSLQRLWALCSHVQGL